MLLIGGGLGLLMGLIIQYFDIQPFIVTLAGMFLARGLCYVISLDSIPVTEGFFTGMAQAQIPLPGTSSSRRVSSWPLASSAMPSSSCTTPASAGPSTPSAATSTQPCSWACR